MAKLTIKKRYRVYQLRKKFEKGLAARFGGKFPKKSVKQKLLEHLRDLKRQIVLGLKDLEQNILIDKDVPLPTDSELFERKSDYIGSSDYESSVLSFDPEEFKKKKSVDIKPV